MHSSPQPVPISSTRLPGPTRAASSRRSILRRCASASCDRCRRQRVEQRAGVGHRLVEELGEQLIGQVVVLRDVPPGLLGLLSCERGWRTTAIGRSRCSAARNQVGHRLGELGEHADEVVRAPLAGHVGLAEADQAVAADPARQPRRAGESPSSAASGRPRRPPIRPGRPAAAAGGPPHGGAADRRSAPTTTLSGPDGTRATSGQRSESDCGADCFRRCRRSQLLDPFLLGHLDRAAPPEPGAATA